MKVIKKLLKGAAETESLGLEIASKAQPNWVIALRGDLGAGKTTLTKAIAKGLGIKETVTSPTFTVVCEYKSGRLPLYHFDVYRVSDSEELFEIGFDEYLAKGGVCVIEWADLLEEGMLPEDTIYIDLRYGASEEERVCELRYPCSF